MNEADAALGPAERLHPLSLLASLRASLKGMWGMFAAGGYFAVQGHWLLLVVMFGIFALLSVGAAVFRWMNFSFRVGEREIRIDSGLMSRTHRSIPFDRIQDVTVEQGPLARALGLARVRFETGGSSGGKEDDGSLAAIPLQRAGQIRDLVRARRGLAPAASTAEGLAQEEQETPIFVMNLRRVLLEGVFNFSLAVLGGLVGLSQTVGETMGIDPFEEEFWLGLFAAGTPLGDFLRGHTIVTAFAGALVLVLIGLGTGLLRTLLRDYGFRLDLTANGLRRRRGLLTVTDVVLPAKRTQAAIVASGPVRDRFGWSALKFQSLAKEDGGKGDHVVAPLADEEEVGAVLDAIDWPQLGRPAWRNVSKAYVWALAAAVAPLALLAAGLMAVFGLVYADDAERQADLLFVPAVFLIGLLVALATRWLAWRRYAYALDGDRLLVRSGWWRRRIKILPVRNIQSVDYVQLIVDRWFGTAALTIGVAGGGLTGHGIKALPAKTAREIRTQLLSPFA
jgi:putative membrane protein